MNNFSFEERMEEIDNSISAYNELKQSSFISASDNLKKIIENSIVIAIYSLSEQLLKDTIYKILEVDFSQANQTYKDKFILDKMPPKTYSITPDIARIKNELRVYNKEFDIKVPKIVSQYKDEYEKLIKARHKYAHGNKHTQDIDFDYAKKFVEYLRVEYEDLVEGNSIVSDMFKLKTELNKLLKHNCKDAFKHHYENHKDKLDENSSFIRDKIDSNPIYDIDYIDILYISLEKILEGLENIYQNNEYIQDDSFEKDMNSLKQELSDYN